MIHLAQRLEITALGVKEM